MQPVKRFRGVLLVLPALGVLGGAPACGPSFQAIYEGNARFEHCYALEEHPQTAMHDKADCWRDWSEHYTYGQTRDRIHYAIARYVALSQSTNVPTDEAMMMAAPGMTPRQSTITAPSPTNAFAPPPKVLDDYPDAGPGRASPLRPSEVPTIMVAPGASAAGAAVDAGRGPEAAAPPLPAAGCGDVCGGTFRHCKVSCTSAGTGADAGKDAACTQCDKTYRACMRGCFK